MKLSAFEMSMYLAQMLDPESTEYSVNTYFEIAGAGEEEVEALATLGFFDLET